MKTLNKIWVVCSGYPTKDDPQYAFIQPIVHEMANRGILCDVFAPQSFFSSIKAKKKTRPKEWIDINSK